MIVVLARKTMGGSNNVITSDKERWIKAEEDHRENCFTDADYPVDKEVIAQVSLLLNNASRKKRSRVGQDCWISFPTPMKQVSFKSREKESVHFCFVKK